MPILPTYPGVYIEERESGVRPISGVATSVAAFVGYTARGLDNRPQRLFNWGDYERAFGGMASDSLVSYSVAQFFNNGGAEAWVVRVPRPGGVAAAVTTLDDITSSGKESLALTALSLGGWANDLLVDVDHDVPAGDAKAFNLTITDVATGTVEVFSNVSLNNSNSNFVEAVVNDVATGSRLVTVKATPANGRPAQTGTVGGAVTLGDLKTDKKYTIKLDVGAPVTKTVEVVVLEPGDVLPSSVLGLCGMLERRINMELSAKVPGAQVRCTPTAAGAIRLRPDFSPELQGAALDATLTPAAGSTNSALTMLSLDAAKVNAGHYRLGSGRVVAAQKAVTLGQDGAGYPGTNDLVGSPAAFTGIYALDRVDGFNLLCIPDATRPSAADPKALSPGLSPNDVWAPAQTYCQRRRAMLLIDPPPTVRTLEAALDWISSGLTVKSANSVAYFPRIRAGDPLDGFKPRLFAPSGALAGVMARTDTERGVWKAPAGTARRLNGVSALEYKLTDAENGVLNPLGLNCLRTFPIYGTVAWGARTLDGADAAASQWRYLSVRRLALMIEEALFRGTQWAVFEPNDEPLWAELRLNVNAFMQGLFRQGAFQGSDPTKAYLVKCDSSTTVQSDIDRGVVNVLVGFAPLKPAEFVFIQLQQLAGQSS